MAKPNRFVYDSPEEYTIIRKSLDSIIMAKHAQGMHDQKTHGRRGAAAFFNQGGQISKELNAGDEEIEIARATLDQMKEMFDEMGEGFGNDEGVRFTEMALEASEEEMQVRLATMEEGLGGAIAYSASPEIAEMPFDEESGEPLIDKPMMMIAYLGSTGILPGTGSALAQSVFEEAAKQNLGILLQPASAGARTFWNKVGIVNEAPGMAGYLMATAEEVKELVKE